MVHAIRVREVGGPDVLQWEEVEVGEPGTGQVRLQQHAVGLNYIDVYHRTGLYPQPLPFTPGTEGAGDRPGDWRGRGRYRHGRSRRLRRADRRLCGRAADRRTGW